MKKCFPIGSIVLLKNGEKRLMITGRYTGPSEEAVYDYSGVPYPEGMRGTKLFFFDEDSIDRLLFLGFQDMEEAMFLEKVLKPFEKARAFDSSYGF